MFLTGLCTSWLILLKAGEMLNSPLEKDFRFSYSQFEYDTETLALASTDTKYPVNSSIRFKNKNPDIHL